MTAHRQPPPPSSPTNSPSNGRSTKTVIEELRGANATFAMTFAGQGAAWLDELVTLYADSTRAKTWIDAAAEHLLTWRNRAFITHRGAWRHGMMLSHWLTDDSSRPTAPELAASATSQPLVFVTQMARFLSLTEGGLDAAIRSGALHALTGHSQGLVAACAISEAGDHPPTISRLLEYLDYMVLQGILMEYSWRDDAPSGEQTPMAAVSGPTTDRLVGLVHHVNQALPSQAHAVIALHNTPTRHVLSGPPRTLGAIHAELGRQADQQRAAKKVGRFAGSPLSFTWESLAVSTPSTAP